MPLKKSQKKVAGVIKNAIKKQWGQGQERDLKNKWNEYKHLTLYELISLASRIIK